MSGPWEQYQTPQAPAAGPWTAYQPAPAQPQGQQRPGYYAEPDSVQPGYVPPHLPTPTPAEASPAGQRGQLADAAGQIIPGLIRGGAGVAGFIGSGGELVNAGLDWASGQANQYLKTNLPTSPPQVPRPEAGTVGAFLRDARDATAQPTAHQVLGAVERNVTGPLPQPQTAAGRYTGAVAEFLPGLLLGRPSAPTMSNVLSTVVAPAVTSETLGHAVRGTALEPVARVGGALMGGYGAARLTGPPLAERMAGSSARGFNDADFDAAGRLLRDGGARGVSVGLDEALTSASGQTNNPMTSLRRVVDQTQGGGPRMAAAMAERAPQVERMLRRNVDQIAPATAEPSVLGPRMQRAGEGVMRDVESQRTAAVDPHYRAAATDRVPATDMERLLTNIERQAAEDTTGILAPRLREIVDTLTETQGRAAVPGQRTPHQLPNGTVYRTTPGQPAQARTPITDIENLDRARKYFRDRLDLPQIGGDAITREQAGVISGILTDLDRVMLANSPQLQAGRQLYANLSDTQVAPMSAGPAGRISRTGEVTEQARELTRPIPGSEGEVALATRLLGAQNPEATAGLARLRVEGPLNDAMGATRTGQTNPIGGAQYAGAIRHNTQEARNIGEMLGARPAVPGAITPGPEVRRNFERSLDVAAATGARPAPGSGTTFNAQISSEMAGTKLDAGLRPLAAASDWVRRHRMEGTSSRLAELLLSGPGGLDRLRELARGQPMGELMARILMTQQGGAATRQPSR